MGEIDDGVPAGTLDKTTFEVQEAPSSVIEAIVKQVLPGLPYEDQRRLERFSRGFPKIAVLVAQAWTESRPIAHAMDDDLVDAFILGRRHQDRDLLLESVALLATFGLVRVGLALTSREVEVSKRSLHPVMVRLFNEFGDGQGVLHAIAGNIRAFGSGPLTSYFALYEEPLGTLRDHPTPKVRRWAKVMLRELSAMKESARNEDEEWDARWEV